MKIEHIQTAAKVGLVLLTVFATGTAVKSQNEIKEMKATPVAACPENKPTPVICQCKSDPLKAELIFPKK